MNELELEYVDMFQSQYRSIKDSKGGYGIYLHLQYKDGKYKDELMMMVHPQLIVDCGIDEYVKELVEELNEELYDYLKHR